eukprot:748846-Amphidinium_carterae.1
MLQRLFWIPNSGVGSIAVVGGSGSLGNDRTCPSVQTLCCGFLRLLFSIVVVGLRHFLIGLPQEQGRFVKTRTVRQSMFAKLCTCDMLGPQDVHAAGRFCGKTGRSEGRICFQC